MQKIPDREYLAHKRSSVFHRVDTRGLDNISIPNYQKTEEEMGVIMPLLRQNLMTMNLSEELQTKIAGAMRIVKYETGDKLITYGEEGKDYFVLSRGKVQVIVY